MFEIRHAEGASRLGLLRTRHGDVRTPTLMPVINPNRPLIPGDELRRDFGVTVAITNAYILATTDALRQRALDEGVHRVAGFDGPLMTDSGTFQQYVYGSVRVTNREIVEFQRRIGSTIGTILDVFTVPATPEAEARQQLDETLVRAADASGLAGDMTLALPVQGGLHAGLRADSARGVSRLTPAGGAIHPIGGVVPLMEQQRYAELARVILAAKAELHPGRAVHLFGAGHPHVFPLAVALGCDLFDSAAYAKFAADDRLLFPSGTVQLAELEENPCTCPACRRHTPAEVRALEKAERTAVLARHNLHVTMSELARVRDAQRRGRLWELVLERARAHPQLALALEAARGSAWLRGEEPATRGAGALLAPDAQGVRGDVAVFRQRARRVPILGRPVLLPPADRPFGDAAREACLRALERGEHPFFPSLLGPVPLGLDHVYPAAQSVEPPIGPTVVADCARRLADWDAPLAEAPRTEDPLDGIRVLLTVAYQWGAGAAARLPKALDVSRSRATGKARTVGSGPDRLFAVRASDGFLVPQPAGARLLHGATGGTLTVTEDAAPFVRDGKSVMGRFVAAVGDGVRPLDEILVVYGDELLGAGTMLVSAREAVAAERGVVAKVRFGTGPGGHQV